MWKVYRYGFSILFAIACLSVCVLWVRSYWQRDHVDRISATTVVGGSSNNGLISAFTYPAIHPYSKPPMRPIWQHRVHTPYSSPKLLRIDWSVDSIELTAPHWLLAIYLATIATLPWIPRRFSMRSLLIAMTAVACLLALTVLAAR